MTNKEIIENFRNLVEEYREEMFYEFYIQLRDTLDILEKQEQELEKKNKILDKLKKEMNRDDLAYTETQFVLDILDEEE